MTDTSENHRGPIVFEDVEQVDGQSPENAAPVPDVLPEGQAMQQVTRFAACKSSWITKMFWGAISALLAMAVSLAFWDFVTGLLQRNIYLGRFALVLAAIAGLALIIVCLRELAAFARLAKIDKVRHAVNLVKADGSIEKAKLITGKIANVYAGREEMRWPRQAFEERQRDVIDGNDLILVAERTLIAPLDALAEKEVQVAARNVAGATALLPIAFMDMLVALSANIRMVRRIAEVYGGRAGFLGSWRLFRAVAAHLLATGAVAVGDDLVGSMVGGGALAKVSRRFGEGVINGALTARVGIAAMEVCRPMDFDAVKRPSVTATLKKAMVGLFK